MHASNKYRDVFEVVDCVLLLLTSPVAHLKANVRSCSVCDGRDRKVKHKSVLPSEVGQKQTDIVKSFISARYITV